MKREKNNRPYLTQFQPNEYQKYITYSLIFLLCYGFYKNGLLPIFHQDANIWYLLKLMIYPIGGYLFGKISEKYGKNQNGFYAFYGLLIGMSMPIQLNWLLFLLILGILFWLFQIFLANIKWFSPLLLSRGIFSLLIVINSVSFLNPSEGNQEMVYTTLDIFFGRSIGGIYTTTIFWLFITFLILCFHDLYKKEIPVFVLITYIMSALCFEIFLPIGNLLLTILNSSTIFASIFLASEIVSAPYIDKSKWTYGILVGFFGFLFVRFINVQEGIYLSLALCSFLPPLLDKWFYHRQKKRSFVDSSKPKIPFAKNNLPKLKKS